MLHYQANRVAKAQQNHVSQNNERGSERSEREVKHYIGVEQIGVSVVDIQKYKRVWRKSSFENSKLCGRGSGASMQYFCHFFLSVSMGARWTRANKYSLK